MCSRNEIASVDKIDFIIPWVDGNDEAWRKEKNQFNVSVDYDAREQRYRDWDNLKYWFRGVEKYAPWVNKIYFVTWGHIPEWLNVENEKLVVVKHSDFIPKQYLPTFNASTIELNFHRIEGLSEKFVVFNDDLFLISKTKKTDFFKKGMPCDTAALNVHCLDVNVGFNYASFQAIGIVNKYFPFHSTLLKNWKKWFNLKNGKLLLRTLYLFPCPRFSGIYQPHLANSYLKTTYLKLWEKEEIVLNETCTHKFRNKLDYSQWVFRNWQLASGNFENRKIIGKSFYIEEDRNCIDEICSFIEKQKGKMVCINDGEMTNDKFEKNKIRIIESFEKILPDKSKFER